MKKFYRVEDGTRKGMYRTLTEAVWEMQGNDNHPAPRHDSKLVTEWGERNSKTFEASLFRYGFDSIEQLRRWLYEDRWVEELHDAGQMLAVYEVPDEHFYAGHTQAVVEKEAFLELEPVRYSLEKCLEHSFDLTKVEAVVG